MNELKHILALAEAQNWRVETGSTHLKLYPPPPQTGFVTAPASPSDWRAYKNLIGEMTKFGFKRPRKHQKGKRLQADSLKLAVAVDLPYRNVATLASYPYIGQLLGRWRSEDWFDEEGLPLGEDEWTGPDDDSLMAAILLEPHGKIHPDTGKLFFEPTAADHRNDKKLRIHYYALKFWGGVGQDQEHLEEQFCACGFAAQTSGALELADHVLPYLEQGCTNHHPEGLLEWYSPDELEELDLALKIGDLEEFIFEQNESLRVARKELKELQSRWDSIVRAVQPHIGSGK